jgi:hypothetical protein
MIFFKVSPSLGISDLYDATWRKLLVAKRTVLVQPACQQKSCGHARKVLRAQAFAESSCLTAEYQ